MVVTNGDFEFGATGWTLAGNASIGATYGAHGGSSALAVKTFNNPPDEGNGQATSDAFDLVASYPHALSFWIKLDTGTLNDLSVYLDSGSGLALLETFDVGTHGSGWVLHEYEFTAGGASGQIRFETEGVAGPGEPGLRETRWLVDDILLGRDVITALIRTAIATDFGDISIANGFEIDVTAVYTEPKRIQEREFPSIALVPDEGGESDIATLTNRTGIAEHWCEAELMVKSDTPHADIQKLLDSARNCVERTGSATWTVSNVRQVDAASWERINLTDADIAKGYAIYNLSIRVEYKFARGAA